MASAVGIAADPPDTAFTSVAQPPPNPYGLDEHAADPLDAAINKVGNRAWEVAALQGSVLHAMERIDGAVLAGQSFYVQMQARALDDFANRLAMKYAELTAAIGELRTQLTGNGLTWSFTPDDVARFTEMQSRLQVNGFNNDELAMLIGNGLTSAQIERFRQLLIDLGPLDAAATSDGALANLADAATAARTPCSTPMSGRESRRERRPAHARHAPPTAAVAAAPIAGIAPVTVTFDGRGSSDGEGPIVDYHWFLATAQRHPVPSSPTPSPRATTRRICESPIAAATSRTSRSRSKFATLAM